MTIDEATELIRQTLMLALVIAAPMLVIGMIVGVIISLFQAVTQIQEQTLLKITAMIGAAMVLMPWIGQRLLDYASAMFSTGKIP